VVRSTLGKSLALITLTVRVPLLDDRGCVLFRLSEAMKFEGAESSAPKPSAPVSGSSSGDSSLVAESSETGGLRDLVQGLGFEVWGSGFKLYSSSYRNWNRGVAVFTWWFRVWGFRM